MNQLYSISNAWLVPIPQSDSVPVNFQFPIKINNTTYQAVFKWYANMWNCWVTFSESDIRQAGIFPGCISWSAYDDFGLFVKTDLDVIGQLDLPNIQLYFLQWGP